MIGRAIVCSILGDLQLEFGSAPEKGEELPLEELVSALGSGYSESLVKYTSGARTSRIARLEMSHSLIETCNKKCWEKSTIFGVELTSSYMRTTSITAP